MVTEFICGYTHIMDIIQFFALIGIAIGAGFVAYGIKTAKKTARRLRIKPAIITSSIFILTLIISFFDTFIC